MGWFWEKEEPRDYEMHIEVRDVNAHEADELEYEFKKAKRRIVPEGKGDTLCLVGHKNELGAKVRAAKALKGGKKNG